MFDIAWTEMLVIAIVLIVVVGPKELPGMLRTFGKTTARLRTMAGEFRKQFDEALKEAELDDLKKLAEDAKKLNPAGELKKAFNPLDKAGQDVRAGLEAAFSPPKTEVPKPAPAVTPPEAAVPAKPAVTPAAAAAKSAAPAPKAAPAAKPAAAKAAPAKPVPAKAGAAKAAPVKAPPAKPAAAKAAAPKKKTGGAAS